VGACALRGVAGPLAEVELPPPLLLPLMTMEFLHEEEERKKEDGSSVN
jgi:hypothetical protein